MCAGRMIHMPSAQRGLAVGPRVWLSEGLGSTGVWCMRGTEMSVKEEPQAKTFHQHLSTLQLCTGVWALLSYGLVGIQTGSEVLGSDRLAAEGAEGAG